MKLLKVLILYMLLPAGGLISTVEAADFHTNYVTNTITISLMPSEKLTPEGVTKVNVGLLCGWIISESLPLPVYYKYVRFTCSGAGAVCTYDPTQKP